LPGNSALKVVPDEMQDFGSVRSSSNLRRSEERQTHIKRMISQRKVKRISEVLLVFTRAPGVLRRPPRISTTISAEPILRSSIAVTISLRHVDGLSSGVRVVVPTRRLPRAGHDQPDLNCSGRPSDRRLTSSITGASCALAAGEGHSAGTYLYGTSPLTCIGSPKSVDQIGDVDTSRDNSFRHERTPGSGSTWM
jgi:hypothetical protein